MNTDRKVFRDKRVATGAKLGSAIGVHHYKLSRSLYRFRREYANELSPTSVSYGFGKTMIVQHPVDIQLFNSNNTKGINQSPRLLMNKVVPSISNAFMDAAHDLFGLVPFRCPLLQFRQFPLSFSQCLFITSEEARIGYLLTGRQGSKALQPDINTDHLIQYWQWLWLILNSEAGIPLTSLSSNSASLDLPKGLPMKFNFNTPNLSQLKVAIFNVKTKLGESKAIIPIVAPKSGIAGLFTSLNSSKKCLEGFIQPIGNILKHLRINITKSSSLNLQFPNTLALLEIRKSFLLLFPAITAFFQKFIIQPTAFIKLGLKCFGLVLGGKKPIFKRFFHMLNHILKEGGCQANSSHP